MRHADDGLHDERIGLLDADVAHEALVDLELVQRQPREVRQRRLPGAEVVHRKPQPQRAQGVHLVDGVVHVLERQALRQLQLELLGPCPRLAQHRHHPFHEVRMAELPGAHVHGHLQ